MRRRAGIGECVCLALAGILAPSAGAQSLLLLSQPDAPLPQFRIAGVADAALTPPRHVPLERGITVLIDPGALAPRDLPVLRQGLGAVLARYKGAEVDLVLLSGPPGTAIAIKTSSQLAAALRKMIAGTAGETPAVALEELIRVLEAMGSAGQWRQVLYVGREPAVPSPSDLRDYAFGVVARTLSERRIRLCHWLLPAEGEPSWGPALAATAGSLAQPPESLLGSAEAPWLEVPIPALFTPGAGFRVAAIVLRSTNGNEWRVPWVWQAPGTKLPGFDEYRRFLELRARLDASGARDTSADAGNALSRLLEVNPYDFQSLRIAAGRAERLGDYRAAAGAIARMLELEPLDGQLWSRRGYCDWRLSDGESAERHLLRGRELGADHEQSAAILGDIRFRKGDYARALVDYRQAVDREPNSTALWIELAETQKRLGRRNEAAQSLEAVLRLEPGLWERRTELIDHYFGAGDRTAAARNVQTALQILPDNAALIPRFADYCERLERPAEAMPLWSRMIALQPGHEPAHHSLARLRADAKEWEKALASAEAGIAAVPSSGRLRAVAADALLALGRLDEARQFLRRSAELAPAAVVLERAADLEDRYGTAAPRHYRALVTALRESGAPESSWGPLAAHGLRASIRDRDLAACRWFAQLTGSDLCGPAATRGAPDVVHIPGGFQALLYIANGPARSSPEAFLADYSRTLRAHMTGVDRPIAEAYAERILDYFRLLADVKSMGRTENGKTVVRLSLADGKTARVSNRVLSLLGWTARRRSGKIVVEPAASEGRARGQILASALAIDVVQMQERLQQGGEFLFEILDEPVSVFPGERSWEAQFFSGSRLAGGFAEAMARNPPMASLYAALAAMDPESAKALVASIGMKRLAERYGSLLALYSPSIQISAARLAVPGGDRALPVWASLLKADPANLRHFIEALLDKDDGRLLRFYFLLSQLDVERQHFFTANPARTAGFYDVFRESSQVEGRIGRDFGSPSIHDFFRELPIDSEGRILFPGSPEVWIVARSRSSSVASTERRLRRLSRVTTPDVEDEILLRLLRSEYASARTGAWQNFLAAVRIDAARSEPLDETSALLLAENYGPNPGLYAYFTRLSALESNHYREVFLLAEKIRTADAVAANAVAGQFHAVLHLLSQAERSGRLRPAQAAGLLLGLCRAMNQASSPGAYAKAALDFLELFAGTCGVADPALAVPDALLPQLAAAPAAGETSGRVLPPGANRRRDYDRVLELQKIPSLRGLLRIRQALDGMSAGKGDLRKYLDLLLEGSKALVYLEAPRQVQLDRFESDVLESDRSPKTTALNRRFQREIARKKVNPKRLQELALEYWDAVAYQTAVGLVGQVYAAHLSPADLLVAEDPLFVRKHRFVSVQSGSRTAFEGGGLKKSSTAGGSHAVGGFDGLAFISGEAAVSSLTNIEPPASAVAAALIGSVRLTDWSKITTESARFAALQVRAARDLLVFAATDAGIRNAVSQSAYGMTSLNRRTRLLRGLRERDWPAVWSSLSLTDLYFLAARLERHPGVRRAGTPAIAAWMEARRAAGATAGQQELGSVPRLLRGYPAPVLFDLAPYEDTATEKFPAYLAERVAEFKVYLACLIVEQALPATVLPAVAESAARDVIRKIQMSGAGDWESVLEAYAGFDAARLQEIMATP